MKKPKPDAMTKPLKGPSMPSMPSKPPSEDNYKAESDFRVLMDAEEVKADPERYKRAIAAGKPKAQAIRSLDELHSKIKTHLSKKASGDEEEKEMDAVEEEE